MRMSYVKQCNYSAIYTSIEYSGVTFNYSMTCFYMQIFLIEQNRMYIELGLQIILSKSRSEKLTLKPGYFCHNLCVTPSCHLSDKRNRENAILRSKEKVS